MPAGGLTTPKIAVGLAVVAVVMSALGVAIVLGRGAGPTGAEAKVAIAEDVRSGPPTIQVEATDVVKLERDAVEPGTSGASDGLKVTDAELRGLLGLRPDDLITSLSGRKIRRQFDVYSAIQAVSTMEVSTLYVELIRDEAPLLVRWEVAGDLRKARLDRLRPSRSRTALSSSVLGLAKDPLLDTIEKVDELHYKVPRATLLRLDADPVLLTKGMRAFPMKPYGFRVYPRPGSFGEAFGFKVGDAIRSVNGQVLTRPDSIAGVYAVLKDDAELRIEFDRRGQPTVLKITVLP